MKKLIVLLFLILLTHSALAVKEGHLKLLAVSEKGMSGSVADLFLEIRDGKGRVFLETFPLTKVDTQISMRFAKQVACKRFSIDCSSKDFIYTINAGAGIIGGPSAGAAASVLTASLLLNIPANKSMSITGTINSGGVIGSVGGIREKIEAAANSNLTAVLIPIGERYTKIERGKLPNEVIKKAIIPENKSINQSNSTMQVDLLEYGKELGVQVLEVGTLNEAIHTFTGYSFPNKSVSISLDPRYNQIMLEVSKSLCDRTDNLMGNLEQYNTNKTNQTSVRFKEAKEFQDKASKLFQNEEYYSAASFCFRANVAANNLVGYFENKTRKQLLRDLREFEKNIEKEYEQLSSLDIKTITDLQTFIIVKDRLSEAETYISKARETLKNENETAPFASIALADERIQSARSWSEFFGMPGKRFQFEKHILQQSCLEKIQEAQERYQYLALLLPNRVDYIRELVDQSYKFQKEAKYPLCLFEASKAKAGANILISLLGSTDEQMRLVRDRKLRAAAEAIVDAQQNNMFPLIGYSYYRYSEALEDDMQSSLLFAEYALELSNFDMYFPEEETSSFRIDWDAIFLFLLGLLIGIFVMEFVKNRRRFSV